MTRQAFAYLAAGGGVLLLAASVLLLLPGSSAERLRARAREATGIDERPAIGPKPRIRVVASDEQGYWDRLLAAFGHNPNLPPAYAASVPLVLASSALVGVLIFWRAASALGSGGAGILAVLVVAAVVRFQFRRKARIYNDLLFTQFADCVSLVVRSVRAGLPVGEALRSIGTEAPSPSSDEFSRVMGEVALGVPLETALWNLHARTRIREHSFLAVTMGLHAQTGGNLAETLENLADILRRRMALAAKARALSAESRLSAMILAGLPFVTGAAMMAMNPGYIGELFIDPRGTNFLFAFAVLLSAGLLTIRWLIQRSTQD